MSGKKAKEQRYTQCRMKKGYSIQTAWIPEKFAVMGKILRKKDDIGWMVTNVFSTMDEKDVKMQERVYKTHGKVSDI